MIQIEVDEIKEVLEQASKNKTEPYASILYERFQSKIKGKEMETIVGNIIISAIGKILDETTIFYYKEEIGSTDKIKKEELQEKCREEIDELIKTLKEEKIPIKKGAIGR